ncbi:transposase, partial [Megasphaera elsdenii]|uniref:transposase n=1 Tax=Megasphaera elsdenii TaxID=907 RepID=UPI003D08C367
QEKAVSIAAKLREMKLLSVAKKVEDSVGETLTYMDFPTEHWSRIRTNNLTERVNREIRRRTRAIGAFFPNGNSALMLVCARFRHVAASKWGSKRYMDMEHLFKMEIEQLADEENPYI